MSLTSSQRGDVAGMVRAVGDDRFSQPSALRAIVALPYNHTGGVDTNDTDKAFAKDLTYFSIFKLTEATDHVVLEYDNFHTGTSNGETNGGKIVVSACVWIRLATTSTFYGPFRATFRGGATSVTIHPRTRVRTDPLLLGMVPAGNDIRVHTYVQAATGINYPTGRFAAWGSQGYQTGDQTETAVPTLTSYAGYAPCAIWRYGDTASGLALVGDSRIYGTGETSGLTGGWAARGCYARNIGTVIAAKSGERLDEWLATYTRRQNRLSLCASVPYAVLGYGINDLTGVSPRSYAQLVADFATAIKEIYQMGTRVFVPDIMPYTDSTDSYATAANQFRHPNFTAGAETTRQQFNADLLSGALNSTFGPGFAGPLRVCELVAANASNVKMAAGDRYYATGATGTGAYAPDGLHLSSLGATVAQDAISAAIANLIRKGSPYPRMSQLVPVVT